MANSYPPNGLSPVALTFPECIQLGLGDKEYISPAFNATFSAENPPDILPDLSKHFNYMAKILRSNPELYAKLKGKKTKLGDSLAYCIKTGINNLGHELLPNCGLTVCDEQSYKLFYDLFEPIIRLRHDGYIIDKMLRVDTSSEKLNLSQLDLSGRYILTCRVRCARSIKGYRLPPIITFDERRSIERDVVKALKNLKSNLAGDYFPLHGSRSYEAKPGGMPQEKETELRSSGFLFQKPDNPLILSSGIFRHWPDARGIFINKDENAFVWINEEDHLRIIAMEKGQNMQAVFSRNLYLTNALETELKKLGQEFMFDKCIGNMSTCPSNVGTGMRIGCLMKIPLLSSRSDFKVILKSMGLQARGVGGVFCEVKDGIVDVSNECRIGLTEVEYANLVIRGVMKLIDFEKKIELGGKSITTYD